MTSQIHQNYNHLHLLYYLLNMIIHNNNRRFLYEFIQLEINKNTFLPNLYLQELMSFYLHQMTNTCILPIFK